MSHPPDPRAHDTHPRELIAAHAAGDAGGADLATATTLVARCPACAELHRDLRAIAAALPATAVPPRTRDHRLDPARAARLRPAGWRGLIAPLGGRRFTFLAPMGATLATLGLAGLLVATLPAIPLGGAAAERMSIDGLPSASAAPPVPNDPAATAVPVFGAGSEDVGGALGPSTGGTEAPGGQGGPRSSPADPKAREDPSARDVLLGDGRPAGPLGIAPGAIALGATVALVTGLGLLLLRWSARRVS